MDQVIAAVRRATAPFDLVRAAEPPERSLAVLALGKAAPAMDAAVDTSLGLRLVITTTGTELWGSPDHAELVDHPLPSASNARAGARAMRFLDAVKRIAAGDREVAKLARVPEAALDALLSGGTEDAPLVLLLSGGASACLSMPMPSLTIEDIREVTSALLRAGASIDELNIVRRHIELLKGGRLAKHLHPVPIHTLILSDVVSGDVAAIGSGPVSPDPSTFEHARDVLLRYGVSTPGVVRFIEQGIMGLHPDTAKPGDEELSRVTTRVIGHSGVAVAAVRRTLEELGVAVHDQRLGVTGDACEVGRTLGEDVAALRQEATRIGRPVAIVLGGETTVRVGTAGGKGGRNQELALAAAVAIEGVERAVVATFATDGVDGPTDAAGAVVTGTSAGAMRAAGVDPRDALARHDSWTALGRINALIRTGPTGTNVNDIAIGMMYPGV